MIRDWCVILLTKITVMRETKHSVDWRDGFLFVGNDVALDFLNTRPVLDAEPVELLPDFKALVRWFQVADLVSSREAEELERRWAESLRARRIVQSIREFRETIRKELFEWERHGIVHRSAINELNAMMARHPMRSRLCTSGQGLVTQPYFVPQQPEDLIAPLAYSVATLFSAADRTRIRKCDQCVLHFYDTSRKGTRRWCSMRLCGNRLKVAAYAARKRKGSNAKATRQKGMAESRT